MNQTPNYQLNQWEADDKIQRADFNADNAKIDAAIAAAVTKFAIGTYQGTGEFGEDNPNSLTFDFEPKLVIVQAGQNSSFVLAFLMRGQELTRITYPSNAGGIGIENWRVTWSGNTVSWYLPGRNYSAEKCCQIQANWTSTYNYFAIG